MYRLISSQVSIRADVVGIARQSLTPLEMHGAMPEPTSVESAFEQSVCVIIEPLLMTHTL